MQLDDVINSRIGLGPFQIRSFLVLCLVGMNDGVELVLSSFLNPIIKASFPAPPQLTSLRWLAYSISAYFLGRLQADVWQIHGRRRLISSVLTIVVLALAPTRDALELTRRCWLCLSADDWHTPESWRMGYNNERELSTKHTLMPDFSFPVCVCCYSERATP